MTLRCWLGGLLLCFGLLVGAVHADETPAKTLFEEGKASYERRDFQEAYDKFRQSYLKSRRPELLFNMSKALEQLSRPHDAAEELRAYLRIVPRSPQRADIEMRILTLEESQRLLDQERAKRPPPATEPNSTAAPPRSTSPPPTASPVPAAEPAAAPPTPSASSTTSSTATSSIVAAPPPKRSRRTALAIGLGVGAAVVVGVALGVGLGVGLSPHHADPTETTFGTIRATP